MRVSVLKSIALSSTVLSTLIGLTAQANAAQSEAENGTVKERAEAFSVSDDIIVTAQRVEERLQDVPISISVFSQEKISNLNIISAADLGNFTPSMTVSSRYGPEKASFVIRGFVQDLATQPSVGVYFADVVGLRGSGTTTGGNGVGVGNLFDLQSVQVLKGPQGTLFGRNTTGGAVLLVPRKPTDELEGYIEGSLGNYDMRRVQGVLNAPLSDTFKIRFGIDKMKRDGYLKNHSGIGPDRFANTNFTAMRLSVLGNLTPDLENYIVASYNKSNNNGILPKVVACDRNSVLSPTTASRASGAYYGCAQIDRQNARGDGWWDVESSMPNPKSKQETWQAINTTTWLASDEITVKNIASYGEYRETLRYNLEGENFLLPNGDVAYRLINMSNFPGYNNSSQSTFTEEFQVQGHHSDGKIRWQAGGYFENSNPLGLGGQFTTQLIHCTDPFNYQCQANVPNPVVPTSPVRGNISMPMFQTWFKSRGLYAQSSVNLTEKLSFTGGIRYTWDSMTHRYDQTNVSFIANNTPAFNCPNIVRLTPGSNAPIVIPNLAAHETCSYKTSSKSNAPTWLLEADYKPNEDLMLYLKWNRGYRAGGVNALNILLERWNPEKVDTYEAGLKATFRGDVSGYFNAAAFYNDFRDQQMQAALVRAPTSPLIGGAAIVNAGKSRIWGVETDASINLFQHLKIDAGYTYLNTKILEITPPELVPELLPFYSAITPTALRGDRLGLSPKHRLSLTGTIFLPLDESIGRVSFGATYVYTGGYVMSRATLPAFQEAPSTNLVNLNFAWNDVFGSSFDLSAFVTNLTNEKTFTSVSNAWSFGIESVILNEPRMFGARLRYKFSS